MSLSEAKKSRPLWIITAAVLANFLAGLNWTNYPPLIVPISQEFKNNNTQAGLLITASSILAMLLQFPTGYLADRYGSKRVLLILLSILFFPSFLAIFVKDYAQFFLLRILAGVAAPIFPVGSLLIANWYPQHRMGLVQGIFGGAFAFGVGMASLTMPPLATALSWRTAFLISALPIIPTLVIFVLFVKESPRGTKPYTKEDLFSFATVKDKQTWLFTLLNLVFFGTFITYSAWLPTFFARSYNFSVVLAGILAAVSISVGGIARPIGGLLADKYGKKRMMMLPAVIITVMFILVTLGLDFSIVLVSSILIGWFTTFGSGALYGLPPLLFPGKVASVIGFASVFGILVAGLILPPTIGYLLDLTGSFTAGFSILAAIAFVGIIGTLKIRAK